MWLFSRKGISGFSATSTAEEVTQGLDGSGVTAIITGHFSTYNKKNITFLSFLEVLSCDIVILFDEMTERISQIVIVSSSKKCSFRIVWKSFRFYSGGKNWG